MDSSARNPDRVTVASSLWYCGALPFHTWISVSGFSYTHKHQRDDDDGEGLEEEAREEEIEEREEEELQE